MYEIEMHEMSEAFFPVWKAAGIHLSKQVEDGIQSWLRAHHYPPFLEHLSFRLGNQLFFIRVEDVDGKVLGPGNPRGFITAARKANGRACVLPMKKKLFGGAWVADLPGWGLLDAETRRPIGPVALITDQKIEMTPWEVHDMAVQVVRDYLKKQGFELMTWQGNPEVDPSIWFVGKTKRPEWVVVRSTKFPANSAERPSNWQAIAAGCSKMSATGHFASVAVVSVDQPFGSGEEAPVPLWRGHGMHVRFTGLEPPDPNPLGVRLGDLMAMLAPTSIKATLEDNALLARHEHYTTRVEVVPPDDRESENGPIQAVIRMVTELPVPIQSLFEGRHASATAAYNSFAALGALYSDGGNVKIGSRMTIYEAEDSWRALHLPLLLNTTICGAEAILGALRRAMTNEGKRSGVSKWTSRDFAQVEGYLSRVCVCTTGGLGLTAEFGLVEDAVSAARGDRKTALFQLMAYQPHPELGSGLFCLLQMPHQVRDEDRLQKICLQLNKMEMAAHDLPPHFGAWCPGRLGNNPAYVMFLPNALYSASGIAVNTGFWAMNRAQWANAMLASLGERA